ncbi:hypothetical protein HDU76_002999 [Blyttiomyces sp. JEL0837]|nr:hypothetical protein HDU76_002999 [Blyttiomyces sp. JEL0837]
MELEFPLLGPSRAKILIVPVHPLKKDTFRRYVDLISQFCVVSVAEITPPELQMTVAAAGSGVTNQSGGSLSKFSDNLYHDGFMYLNFVTSHNREQAYLEDFQLHRQVMGVIGVVQCPEAENLTESSKRFQQICQRYPSALVTRCFAFEPPDIVPDDVKNLLMIPNEGQLSFYLATMINNFASDLLIAFSSYAMQIERRAVIQGPTMPSATLVNAPSVNQTSTSAPPTAPSIMAPPMSATSSQGYLAQPIPSSGGGGPGQASHPSTPLSASPSPEVTAGSSVANAFGQIGSLLSTDRTKKRTPARAQKLIGDLYLMAGRLDMAMSTLAVAMDIMKQTADFTWHAAALESYYAALSLNLIYRGGLGPIKPSVAGSTESLAPPGTTILNAPTLASVLQSQVVMTPSPIRSYLCDLPERYREVFTMYERGSSGGSGVSGFCPVLLADSCIRIAKLLAGLWMYKFDGVMTGGAAMTLFVPESKGLAENLAQGMGMRGPGTPGPTGSAPPTAGATELAPGEVVLNNGVGVSKVDVSSWLMKAHMSCYFDQLPVSEQVWVATNIASIYGIIGFKRKHAFFLRLTTQLVLGTLKPPALFSIPGARVNPIDHWKRATSVMSLDGSLGDLRLETEQDVIHGKAGPGASKSNKVTNGALECMKRVCDVFGLSKPSSSGGKSTALVNPIDSDDEEEWLDDYEENVDKELETLAPTPIRTPISPPKEVSRSLRGSVAGLNAAKLPPPVPKKFKIPRLRFGWPTLQIEILKQSVLIAQAVDDHANTVYYLTRMLRRMKRHLSPEEQIEISDTLQTVVIRARAATAGSVQPSPLSPGPVAASLMSGDDIAPVPVMVRGVLCGVGGLPVIRKLEVVRQLDQKVATPHKLSELHSSSVAAVGADVFIVSSFSGPAGSQQKKRNAGNDILVKDEIVFFDVVLANPFVFELDIQKISIAASGVNFEALPSSVTVPPESRAHLVRLAGIPRAAGTLKVHGCIVQLFGGCVEEEVYPVQKLLDDPSRKSKDGKRKKQEERERFGKKLAPKGSSKTPVPPPPPKVASSVDRSWSLPIEVIPEQPLLHVTKGDVVSTGAIMLFEGEVELMSDPASVPGQDVMESLEDVYEREVHAESMRAFWVEDKEEMAGARTVGYVGHPVVHNVDIYLKPNEKKVITIGVFGKRNCRGGSMLIQYGCIKQDLAAMGANNAINAESGSEKFYTRDLVVPVILTVEKSLIISNVDVLHLNNVIVSKKGDAEIKAVTSNFERALSLEELMVDPLTPSDESASVDLKSPLQTVAQNSAAVYCHVTESEVTPSLSFKMTVYPGMTRRVFLPVRRILIPDAEARQPLPLPTWKQFVAGRTHGLTLQQDLVFRRAFWLKEYLLGGVGQSLAKQFGDDRHAVSSPTFTFNRGRIRAIWSSGRGRYGGLQDLRCLGEAERLSKLAGHPHYKEIGPGLSALSSNICDREMADRWMNWMSTVSKRDLKFKLLVRHCKLSNGSGTQGDLVSEIAPGRFKVRSGEFYEFEWIVDNCTPFLLPIVLRILPVQSVDLGTYRSIVDANPPVMCLSGSLQTPLSPLGPYSDELDPLESQPAIKIDESDPTSPPVFASRAKHSFHALFLQRGTYQFHGHAQELEYPYYHPRRRHHIPSDATPPPPVPKSKKEKPVDLIKLGWVGTVGRLIWMEDPTIIDVE